MRRLTRRWQWIVAGVGVLLIYKFVDKQSLIEVINRSLPGEEAGLVRGILLGDKTGLAKDVTAGLKKSGLIHLMVASGSNITLLSSGLIETGSKWLGRKPAIVAGLTIIWGYGGMSGWEAPIVRALLLITLYYWAQLLGRKFNLVRGLVLGVGMMLAAEIKIVEELSFWLSITAFIGLVSYPLKNRGVAGALLTTGWISLWTWPVLAWGIGEVSWVAPVTNAAVMVVTETVSVVGAAGVITGLIVPEAGKWLLWLVMPMVKYMLWISNNWGAVWGWKINTNIWLTGGWYLILGYLWRKTETGNWIKNKP